MDLGRVYRYMGRSGNALEAFRSVLANTSDQILRKQATDHINALEQGKR